MSINRARGAYADCFEIFDRALVSRNGIKVVLSDRGKAFYLRTRLNYARMMDREANKEIYSEEDPNYGCSPYDPLIIRTPTPHHDQWHLLIEKPTIEGLVIEEIEDATAASG